MIIARIESLVLNKGLNDALLRAKKYIDAGADGIMIHSRKKIHQKYSNFAKCIKIKNRKPLVVVPSSYSQVTEEKLAKEGKYSNLCKSLIKKCLSKYGKYQKVF